MEEKLIKRFMTSIKCSICGQHYEADHVRILGHKEDLWFLSVFCSACQTECLVAAVVKAGKKPQVTTDLTEAELDRFKKMDRVTADEVLDMHIFLRDFDGDFSQLLTPK